MKSHQLQGNLFPWMPAGKSSTSGPFWESTQKARRTHYCDHCDQRIERGDVYRREVLHINGKLMVLKTHESPGCAFDDLEWLDEESPVELGIAIALEIKSVVVQKIQVDGEVVTEYESMFVPVEIAEPFMEPDDDSNDELLF